MIVDGTYYDIRANVEVVRILERLRVTEERVVLIYGDVATGRAWGDVEFGRVSRSTGRVKCPLIVNNRRSRGGPALLEHCIVGIRAATKPNRWIYKHPKYNVVEDDWTHKLLLDLPRS